MAASARWEQGLRGGPTRVCVATAWMPHHALLALPCPRPRPRPRPSHPTATSAHVGVLRREDDLAVVAPALKLGARRPLQHIVPLEQVVGRRVRRDLRHRLLPQQAAACGAGQAGRRSEPSRAHVHRGGARRSRSAREAGREPAAGGSGSGRTRSKALYSFCSRLMHALLPMAARCALMCVGDSAFRQGQRSGGHAGRRADPRAAAAAAAAAGWVWPGGRAAAAATAIAHSYRLLEAVEGRGERCGARGGRWVGGQSAGRGFKRRLRAGDSL